MAFSDLWRSDRGRERSERERSERERARWREAARSQEQRYGGRDDYTMQDQDVGDRDVADEDFERRGWRPGSDYYGNRPESFGARDYGREQSGTQRYGREDFGYRGYGTGYGGMSGTRTGSFRGRGPRGYSRSDERIREDVCECLTDDAFIDATDIEVVVIGGEVTLGGQVDSRDQKRRAEDIAEQQPGVRDVHNNIRVQGAQGEETGSRRQPGSTQAGETKSTQSSDTSQSSRH